jgi:hypothetical protein
MNFLLTNCTITINRQEMYLCFKCFVGFQVPTYAKYIIFQSPIDMNAHLSKHPLYIHIQNQNFQVFSIGGTTMNVSILNSPLLSWDGILDSKKSNPWFKQYETIFEHQTTI